MNRKKTLSERLQTAGVVVGTLVLTGWLIYTLSNLTAGNLAGWMYLLPAVIMLLLLLVARQKPVLGGVLLLGFGLVIAGRYLDVRGNLREQLRIVLLTGGPYVLVGVLFLLAGIQGRKTNE
jgi:hypothetical protein